MKNPELTLFGCKGCGSAIAESALALGGMTYEYIDYNYDKPAELKKLKKINPLGQVPALRLPDKTILTETAAIINYVHRMNPAAGLIPQDDVLYWRWVAFLIGAIYPTFTYGDFPGKWTKNESEEELRNSTDEHRKILWLQMEEEVRGKYFLGDELTGIDLYIGVMVFWRPRKAWFKKSCPKLMSIATRVSKNKKLKEIYAKNFISS